MRDRSKGKGGLLLLRATRAAGRLAGRHARHRVLQASSRLHELLYSLCHLLLVQGRLLPSTTARGARSAGNGCYRTCYFCNVRNVDVVEKQPHHMDTRWICPASGGHSLEQRIVQLKGICRTPLSGEAIAGILMGPCWIKGSRQEWQQAPHDSD